MRGVTEPQRPPPGPPDGSARAAIEAALTAGDPTAAAHIFQQRLLEITYQTRADALRPWLQHFIDSGADSAGIAHGMLAFFGSRQVRELQRTRESLPALINGVPVAKLIAMGQMIELRLQGDVVGALRQVREFQKDAGAQSPAFDTNDGWELMFAVQVGTTAMLAGDSKTALSAFTAARMHPLVPSLAFLTREATVRSALIHATFGDTEEAQRDLVQADRLPRTGNWIDERSDTSATLVQSLVEFIDTRRARALIDQIELHSVGEMWPYYLIALQRAYERSGYRTDLALKIDIFEALPFPRIPGNGLTGSVLPLISATSAMAAGNNQEAKLLIAHTDRQFVGTGMMRAFLALGSGRASEAYEIAEGLRCNTRGLRQFDLWRLGVMSAALHSLSRFDGLRAAMQEALETPGGIRAEELRHFSADVHQFGVTHVTGWPGAHAVTGGAPSGTDPRQTTFIDELSLSTTELSRREHEILRRLGAGQSRAAIASALFLSINTVKTHLASIYRKLDVNSRASALGEAARRGLL